MQLPGREKTLYGDCSGNFETEPTGVGLSPSDILQYFHHILPHKAVMVINSDVMDESILHLGSQVVVLYGMTTEYSVISTVVETSDPYTNIEVPMVVSIPNDLKIKVAAVEDQPDDDELFQKTRDLFETFDLSSVTDLRRPYLSSMQGAQLHFYEEIGRGVRTRSIVELMKPERVYACLNMSSGMFTCTVCFSSNMIVVFIHAQSLHLCHQITCCVIYQRADVLQTK